VSIYTDDEEEYLLCGTALGNELLKWITNRVQLSGRVDEDEKGAKSIVVTTYKVLEISSMPDEQDAVVPDNEPWSTIP
jgi:hypothetical protein